MILINKRAGHFAFTPTETIILMVLFWPMLATSYLFSFDALYPFNQYEVIIGILATISFWVTVFTAMIYMIFKRKS